MGKITKFIYLQTAIVSTLYLPLDVMMPEHQEKCLHTDEFCKELLMCHLPPSSERTFGE